MERREQDDYIDSSSDSELGQKVPTIKEQVDNSLQYAKKIDLKTLGESETHIRVKAKKEDRDKPFLDLNEYRDGTKNLDFFIHKTRIGIQAMEYDHETVFQEVNDFINVERALDSYYNTCYVSVILHLLNFTKRFVLTFLMRDPFPFP